MGISWWFDGFLRGYIYIYTYIQIFKGIYPLVIKHSHGIDGPFIDGLPINSRVIFHGELLNNQRVYILRFDGGQK